MINYQGKESKWVSYASFASLSPENSKPFSTFEQNGNIGILYLDESSFIYENKRDKFGGMKDFRM